MTAKIIPPGNNMHQKVYGALIDNDNVIISSTNPLAISSYENGFVDSNNETNTPLLSGQTFLGTATDITNYSAIGLMVYADVNSANDGLIVQYSFDSTTWINGEAYTIPSGTTKFFTPPKQGKYYRVSYTNNGTDQTEFHINSLISKIPIKWSSHNIDSTLNDNDDGELVVSVNKLKTAANTYVSMQGTAQGNAKISLEELESGISSNNNTQLNTTLFDSTGVELNIDETTGAICSEEFSHCEIHNGNHFFVKNWMDLTNGQVFDFLAVTPDTLRWIHMINEFSLESEAHIEIYEGTTTSDNGTEISIINRNRNSSTTSGLTLYHTPTITNDGTLISAYKVGSAQKIGGESRGKQELVLKQNTKYLIRITNDTALNNWINYLIDWYEHTNL